MLLLPHRVVEVSDGSSTERAGALEGLMLDIGDGVGALIVYSEERFLGCEVEVSPAAASKAGDPRTHADVHERQLGGGAVFAAVFVALPEGEYVIWDELGRHAGEVAVREGAVGEFLSSTRRMSRPFPPSSQDPSPRV